MEIFQTEADFFCVWLPFALWPNGLFFSHKIEGIGMVHRILNLEGHQHFMIGSKVTTNLSMFVVPDNFFFLDLRLVYC